MVAEGWGFAGELATLAEHMGISSTTRSAAIPATAAGRKRTTADRRAELVVAAGRQIIGIGPEDPRKVLELQLDTREFRERLKEFCPPPDRGLLSCSDDTLKAARLDRRRRPDLPKVELRRGAPPGETKA
jgi:hypothetical protein